MRRKWRCMKTELGFTKGKIYKDDGMWLIDDDGDLRLSAEMYNDDDHMNLTFIRVIEKNIIGGKLL